MKIVLLAMTLLCVSVVCNAQSTVGRSSQPSQVLILKTRTGKIEFFERDWNGKSWGQWQQALRTKIEVNGTSRKWTTNYAEVPLSDQRILTRIVDQFRYPDGVSHTFNLSGDDFWGRRFRVGF